MRFSEEPPSAGAASHVHFDEKLHDSVVMVTAEGDDNFMVKVRSALAPLRVGQIGRPWPDEPGRLWSVDIKNNQKVRAELGSSNPPSVAAQLGSYRSCGRSSTPAHMLLKAL